jgi:lipoprotein-releasing system ATP-binding protein
MNIVELTDIAKTYEDGAPQPVLRGLSLAIAAGDTVAITGPSGCGKSTLLNIIGVLDRPSAGSVRILGRDVSGLGAEESAVLRNRELGFVFQLHPLLPQCTVLENVLVPALAAANGGAGQDVQERARRLLERAGIWDLKDRRPGRISGGERQRVAVARALINRPKLLLADEPTGALDRENAQALIDLLLELNRDEGVALLLVTHAAPLARAMRRVYELRQGRLEFLA